MVQQGIELYKNELAPKIPQSFPFFPLGMPSIEDHFSPISLGLRTDDVDYYAVWRLQGKSSVNIPLKTNGTAEIIYPIDLGIELENGHNAITVKFPEKNMATIIKVVTR